MIPEPIARQPWQMLVPLTLLVFFGAAVLYSAAGGHMQPYATSHIYRFVIFLVLAFGMVRVPREFVMSLSYSAYVGVTVLLIGVEALGAIGGGSQRWLEIGPLRIQPSELMKPTIVLVLAHFYASLPTRMVESWRSLIPVAALTGFPMVLVMIQPDLGTSLAIGFGAVVVMFLAGLPMRWFVGAGLFTIVAIPIAFFFGLREYQQRRVTTFLDPESDPLGAGYHITQSKIAIGSGGFFGKGFNQGTQSHLNYLPEPHTDFIFATMSEEWGMLGGLFVLFCFGLILRWGLQVSMQTSDRFSQLLAGGMVATMFFFVAINTMMVMGLAPVVGIPLPFMSHGGSSMMTNMICIGTLMMINRWNRTTMRRY